MKFECDQQVKKLGKYTSYVTLDCDWGIEPGDMVHITVEAQSR